VEDVTVNPSGRIISATPWLQYANLHGQPQPPSVIRNVTVRHVQGRAKEFGALTNHATSVIENVRLEDVDIQTEQPLFKTGKGVTGVKFINVHVNGHPFQPETARK
jgi:hypothetical protein